jgi:hypothetical protein
MSSDEVDGDLSQQGKIADGDAVANPAVILSRRPRGEEEIPSNLPANVAVVAMANKLARIAWAVLNRAPMRLL